MSYILSVEFFPKDSRGCIVCERRCFTRFYTDFGAVKRKLRYFNLHSQVLKYRIQKLPANV